MGILLFTFMLIVGIFIAFRLLAPEMYVVLNRSKLRFPWQRPSLMVDSAVPVDSIYEHAPEHLPVAIDTPMQPEEIPLPLNEKFSRMDALLLEKNKLIEQLQKDLACERSHRGEFDKVRSIMDEEIARLKDQLKKLKTQKEQAHA